MKLALAPAVLPHFPQWREAGGIELNGVVDAAAPSFDGDNGEVTFESPDGVGGDALTGERESSDVFSPSAVFFALLGLLDCLFFAGVGFSSTSFSFFLSSSS